MTIKKTILFSFIISAVLTACHPTPPERYFDLAVLNCNLITGISGNGSMSTLESPSVKLVEGTKDQTVAMTRKEMMDFNISGIEENIRKLKDLKETDDTREMIQTSLSLNEYVLNIYKTEYTGMARMYDENAPKDDIRLKAQSIHDKYNPQFIEMFEKLTVIGKAYAKKHNINVNWGVQTSPAL